MILAMATSRFTTSQHISEQFVESAGAIPFRLSTQEICILHLSRDDYVLAKGRRNLGESRQDAALREVRKETGLSCQLLPVTMKRRVPPAVETEPSEDVSRTYSDATEPFEFQIRHLQPDGNVKLIWWYIAKVDEGVTPSAEQPGEDKFAVEFYGYEEVLEKLTFQMDRDMVQRAINMVKATYR